jgi:hypothetical protein
LQNQNRLPKITVSIVYLENLIQISLNGDYNIVHESTMHLVIHIIIQRATTKVHNLSGSLRLRILIPVWVGSPAFPVLYPMQYENHQKRPTPFCKEVQYNTRFVNIISWHNMSNSTVTEKVTRFAQRIRTHISTSLLVLGKEDGQSNFYIH